MKKIFGPDLPYADELDQRAVLMLVNSNPAVDFPESLPPNIIQVGGLQIKESKPAPAEFDEFLRKGKKGAVLMSLGTNVRSDEIGQERINMVIEAFRQIPDYNFVWKFETSEMLKNLPSNVKISDWLPQNDLLAHPSLKLFISHAGLLSIHETTWWGVPVVGIPLLADQHRNLHKSIKAEVAVKVDFQTLTTEKLKNAINEVLRNPKYAKNMKLRSQRFRDQPEKPLARAIWWTEFIIRNPTPTHLQPSKFSMGVLGSHFWDIQALIVIALLVIAAIIKKLLKKIFGGSSKVDEKKKKN
jgi:glucuronosyltransferase